MKSSFHQFGDLLVHVYECEAGEGLPTHTHDRATSHMTFVQEGSVEIKVEGEQPKILGAGKMIDLPFGKAHSIMALANRTRFANVRKYIKT